MSGTLHIVGLGPGDPDLMTVKAARTVGCVPVVAFFAKRGNAGHARTMVEGMMAPGVEELRLDYPFTTEISVHDPRYAEGIAAFYAVAAERLAGPLTEGRDVALLCEGDPFFYGSSLALLDRLGGRFRTEVIPGVSGMSGCWTRAHLPMTHGDDVLSVLPGTLDVESLARRLNGCDAAVVMKLGRNLPKVAEAVRAAGLLDRAVYVERGTMAGERVVPLREMAGERAPYFSMVLIPGRQRPR